MENQEVVHEISHDDVVLEFPQEGERLVGLAHVRAMREAYPARGDHDRPDAQRWAALLVTEAGITYDGQRPLHAVTIMELRDGKVVRETSDFENAWDPPAWRAQWDQRTA